LGEVIVIEAAERLQLEDELAGDNDSSLGFPRLLLWNWCNSWTA